MPFKKPMKVKEKCAVIKGAENKTCRKRGGTGAVIKGAESAVKGPALIYIEHIFINRHENKLFDIEKNIPREFIIERKQGHEKYDDAVARIMELEFSGMTVEEYNKKIVNWVYNHKIANPYSKAWVTPVKLH
jgi:hypothetical protein